MHLYTKTGDKGKTALFGSKRVSKDDIRIESYGQVDELNSVLGVVLTKDLDSYLADLLMSLQHKLFDLGSDLATPLDSKYSAQIKRINMSDVESIEKWIDDLESKTSELKNFILPGGSEASAYLHLARTVCRRAERSCVRLMNTSSIEEASLIFLNRLSDFFFVSARYANKVNGINDIEWIRT